MQTQEILAALRQQIADLQRAYDLLAGTAVVDAPPAARRGRPKGSTNKKSAAVVKPRKRVMSAEGKARIADAQKKRWAATKKAVKPVAKKASSKKVSVKKKSATKAPAETTAAKKAAATEQRRLDLP